MGLGMMAVGKRSWWLESVLMQSVRIGEISHDTINSVMACRTGTKTPKLLVEGAVVWGARVILSSLGVSPQITAPGPWCARP